MVKKKRHMMRSSRTLLPVPYPGTAFGVAWYSPEDFASLRQQGIDAGVGCANYDEWLAECDKAIALLRRQGIRPLKVPVTIPELTAWLEERGLANTTEARSEYVAWWMQQSGQH